MREMIDSGIEWIGEYPKSWQLERLQWHLSEIVEKNSPIKTKQVLSLTNKRGVIPYEEKGAQGNIAKENYEDYKIAYPDTIIANSMNILIGSVGYSNYFGCVSPVYYVYKEREGNDLRFINYIMQSSQFQRELRRFANGILEIRLRVSSGDILKRLCVFPEYEEQQRIANFLDSRCKTVDSLIATNELLIEKIKLAKQRRISEAVRGGLKGEEVKETRYFWIGKIPSNWEVGQLKFFAKIRAGITLGKNYKSDEELVEVPYLRVANVQGEYVDLSDVATLKCRPDEVEKYSLHRGELLMTEGGDRDKLGRGCVWNGEISPCIHQNHVFAVTTDEKVLDVHYLDYVTTSDIARTYFDYTAKKTTNLASTNATAIMQFRIPIPPIEQQHEIVRYLDAEVEKYNLAIKNRIEIVNKLQEYKKSLIYEVVTGKKEV